MISRFVVSLFLVFFASSAMADRMYLLPDGSKVSSANSAVPQSCRIALAPVQTFSDYELWIKDASGQWSQDWGHIFTSFGLLDRAYGSDLILSCMGSPNRTGYSVFYAYSTIVPVQSCVAGADARLTKLTTIASFDTNGYVVGAALPASQQCDGGCVVSHPGGQSMPGVAYSNVYDPIAVGTTIWSVFYDSVTYSGLTCNYPRADYPAIAENDQLPPLNTLNIIDGGDAGHVGNSGGGTTGGGLTSSQDSLLNSIYNNTQSATSKLDAIEGKIDSLLNGDGTPGVVTDTDFGVMPNAPQTVTPASGLQSPSEDGITAFKSMLSSSASRAAGTCPVWSFDIALFASRPGGGHFVFDQHCPLINNNRTSLESVMTVVWTIAALALVLKA